MPAFREHADKNVYCHSILYGRGNAYELADDVTVILTMIEFGKALSVIAFPMIMGFESYFKKILNCAD